MNWREVRDATNVRHLLNTARGLGCSVEACLQGSGLDEGVLSAGARIQRWQELVVIRNLVALAPEPGLGLLVGSRYQLTSLGLLGYTGRTGWFLPVDALAKHLRKDPKR